MQHEYTSLLRPLHSNIAPIPMTRLQPLRNTNKTNEKHTRPPNQKVVWYAHVMGVSLWMTWKKKENLSVFWRRVSVKVLVLNISSRFSWGRSGFFSESNSGIKEIRLLSETLDFWEKSLLLLNFEKMLGQLSLGNVHP